MPQPQNDLDKVVEKIRNRSFTEAEIILRKLNLTDRIPEIVNKVFNSSNDNIDVLVTFGSDLREIDLACDVLFALWDEMKANGNRNVSDIIALVNAIETRLGVIKPSSGWKVKAAVFINETISEITNASVEILKEAMISDNYRNNSQVNHLANSIFGLGMNGSAIWDDVIQKVVEESFPQVSATKIAQNLNSHKFLPQVISGLQELFRKLREANNLNNPAILNISESLKKLTQMPNYANLTTEMREKVDTMIRNLPLCARNLFFEPFICIWNSGKSEYLYIAGPEFNRNEDKRSIFTRTTGEVVGPGVWTVEKSDDGFFFRSKAYDDEYLFAASAVHDKENRFVHMWTEGGKVGRKSSWSIELDGNNCYLKNNHYGEYLFASDRQSGEKSRYAFTWIPKTSTREIENFKWQLRDCDLSEILRKGV